MVNLVPFAISPGLVMTINFIVRGDLAVALPKDEDFLLQGANDIGTSTSSTRYIRRPDSGSSSVAFGIHQKGFNVDGAGGS